MLLSIDCIDRVYMIYLDGNYRTKRAAIIVNVSKILFQILFEVLLL